MCSLLQRAEVCQIGMPHFPSPQMWNSCNKLGRRHFVAEGTYQLDGQALPTLRYEDHYKYLGGDLGANLKAHLQHLSQSYITKVKAIAESRLAEWHKLEAIQRFIRSTLDYTYRTMLPTKKWASDIDNQTLQVIKKAFHLPKTTCTPALHCAWKSGGLGLLCIVDLHIAWVSQAFKFLINKDIHVKSVVVEQL